MPHRFSALDGLRGCCALLVVLYHCNYISHLQPLTFIRNGYLFVDFFFVLSGFVISTAYESRLGASIGISDFMLRRFGRVWPLHVAVLTAFILNELAKTLLAHWIPSDQPPFSGNHSPYAILTNLLLVQSLGLHDQLTWNVPSWSISVEFYTYLLFAIAITLIRRHRVAIYSLLSLAGFLIIFRFAPRGMNATNDFGFFRCIYGFFLGCLMRHAYMRALKNTTSPSAWLELAAFLATIYFVDTTDTGAFSFAAPCLFALVVYAFAFERGIVSRLLQTTPMQWLGAWSYSIYMVHFFIRTCLDQLIKPLSRALHLTLTITPLQDSFGDTSKAYSFGSLWTMDALTIFYVALVIALAACTYRYIELPCQRFFNYTAARHSIETKESAS